METTYETGSMLCQCLFRGKQSIIGARRTTCIERRASDGVGNISFDLGRAPPPQCPVAKPKTLPDSCQSLGKNETLTHTAQSRSPGTDLC